MKFKYKPIAFAAVFAATLLVGPQMANAQSTGQAADCNGQQKSNQPCPPVANPNPPPPPVVPAPTPPIVTQPPPPPAIVNPPPPDQTGNWQFDPRRNHRRNHGDAVFRFNFGGFFYDQPYWQQPQYYPHRYYRISCGEGRSIVADNGYNRVRTIECDGITFTYQARRGYRNFRIFVNSRRGTISGVTRLY